MPDAVPPAPPDLVTAIFLQPWIYIVISLVIVLLIVSKWKEKDRRPETLPWYGEKVRKEKMKEQMNRRANELAIPISFSIWQGWNRIGKICNVEYLHYREKKGIKDNKGNVKWEKTDQIKTVYSINYRHYGFVGWIMGVLLHKYHHMLLSPEAVTSNYRDQKLVIDPKAFMLDDSGVWVLASEELIDFADDFIVKKDLENYKGYISDTPRRISNLEPGQAISTEQQRFKSELDEQSKQSRIKRITGG